ncbi:MAG: hypothetical protein LBQ88_21220 [Treponema sp.]|jgi:hypothetical protein|nr:hypothetical protein [Treponema sp.]
MCTIGNVFSKGNLGLSWNSFFKQCDLEDQTSFIEPEVMTNAAANIRYVAFTRNVDGKMPVWSGVNEYGVSFVAADSYLPKPPKPPVNVKKYTHADDVFDMYLGIITQFKNADDALPFVKEQYAGIFSTDKETDILLIGDADKSYFIEVRGKTFIAIKRTNSFFASTNHLRMIYGAVPYESNHSTYLRLARAELILQNNTSHSGIGQVLRDNYYGESVWSICRSKSITVPDEDPYYTQASVIFNIPQTQDAAKDVIIEYVINGNPLTPNIAKIWRPFSGASKIPLEYIGQGDL